MKFLSLKRALIISAVQIVFCQFVLLDFSHAIARDLTEFKSLEGHLTEDTDVDRVTLWSNCGDCQVWEKDEDPTLLLRVEIQGPKTGKLRFESLSALCFRCGGAKGAPITGIPEISKNGVLSLRYSGGSRQYWTHVYKWKFNHLVKAFELIGYTGESEDSLLGKGNYETEQIGERIRSDINYRTRNIEKTVVGKNLKPKKLVCKLHESFKLPSFENFSYDEFEPGDEHCQLKSK